MIVLASGTTATASDIAFHVGGPNPEGWYTVAAQTADIETILVQTGHLFKDVQKLDDSQRDRPRWCCVAKEV